MTGKIGPADGEHRATGSRRAAGSRAGCPHRAKSGPSLTLDIAARCQGQALGARIGRAAACAVVVAGAAGLLPAASGQVQIPPGYEVVQITDGQHYSSRPRMNNHGQIVFMRWYERPDHSTQEIMLYDKATDTLTQLTDDEVQDVVPDINDDGVIVWCRRIGAPDPDTGVRTLEIVMRTPDGQVTRLTDNAVQDVRPVLNSFGQVAWYRYGPVVCRGLESFDIYMYDGSQVRRLTTSGETYGYANQAAEINDLGEIVWTEYDFCEPPPGLNFTSRIMLYSDGQITELTTGQNQPQVPDINNAGQVAWDWYEPVSRTYRIELWEDGVTTRLTDDGLMGAINNRLDVAFFRGRDDGSGRVDMWLHRAGGFYRLTDQPVHDAVPHINDIGEVAWRTGNLPDYDVMYMRRLDNGDMNCDGRIDAFDIEPFILGLFDAQDYRDAYPACDPMLGDMNGDGTLDAFDIEGFIELLFG